MKNLQSIRTKVIGAALLTAFIGVPVAMTAPAQAAPDSNPRGRKTDARRDNDRRNDKRRDNRRDSDRRDDQRRDDKRRDNDRRDDTRGNGYESMRTYRGTVEVLLPGNEFNVRMDGRIYKVYATDSTRDLRVGDSVTISGQMDRGVNLRNARVTRTSRSDDRRNDRRDDRRGDNANRPGYTRDKGGNWRYDPNGKLGGRDRNRNRPTFGNRNDNRPTFGNNRDFNTYSGEVVSVKNSREFRIRSGGREYDVTSDGSARDVSRGDTVSVYGTRFGENDIRNARVTVTRDRYRDDDDRYRDDNRNNNRDDYGPFRTYNGVVTNMKNSREFEVRIDGRTYDVSANNATRDLDRGDEVRVYGQRFGVNDIRNSSVRITRNR